MRTASIESTLLIFLLLYNFLVNIEFHYMETNNGKIPMDSVGGTIKN